MPLSSVRIRECLRIYLWSDISRFCRAASDSWYGPGAVADDLSAAIVGCASPSPLSDVADAMLYFDRSVPEIRDALADAQAESAERASRTVAAESLLKEIFGGEIP